MDADAEVEPEAPAVLPADSMSDYGMSAEQNPSEAGSSASGA